MGDAIDKVADKLPDIYFDWYARFLPGVVATAAMLFYLPEIRSAALRHSAELILLAYVAGHCLQPISSLFVKVMEFIGAKAEDKYAEHKMREKRVEGPLMKISKAHAEAVSMMTTALLLIIVCFFFRHQDFFRPQVKPVSHPELWWAVIFFFASAVLRVAARYRKIDNLGQ